MADTNSKVAWHRVQLKKNRAALRTLEVARFTGGQDKLGESQKTIDELTRKIAESEKCIAAYEQHCDAYECWTTQQLEDFVKALTTPAHR